MILGMQTAFLVELGSECPGVSPRKLLVCPQMHNLTDYATKIATSVKNSKENVARNEMEGGS